MLYMSRPFISLLELYDVYVTRNEEASTSVAAANRSRPQSLGRYSMFFWQQMFFLYMTTSVFVGNLFTPTPALPSLKRRPQTTGSFGRTRPDAGDFRLYGDGPDQARPRRILCPLVWALQVARPGVREARGGVRGGKQRCRGKGAFLVKTSSASCISLRGRPATAAQPLTHHPSLGTTACR